MAKGILFSLLCSTLYGIEYFYTELFRPLNGGQIFGWQLLLGLPLFTLYLWLAGKWPECRAIAVRVSQRPGLFLLLLCSSLLINGQFWLFIWAQAHLRTQEITLGYLLLPLSLILTGVLVYRERLPWLLTAAACLAALGVGHELYRSGGFTWMALLVVIGYPLYLMLRKRLGTDTLGGFWFDLILSSPVALWFIVSGDHSVSEIRVDIALYAVLALLIACNAATWVLFVRALGLLSLSLFALLSFAEPLMLIAGRLSQGTGLVPGEWLTYLPIAAAMLLLVAEGLRYLFRPIPD